MPNLLLDLEVVRVDLVDDGSNSEAFIKLYKRKERNEHMTFDEILAKLKPEHAELIKQEVAKAKDEVPEEASQTIEKLKGDLDVATTDLKKVKGDLEEVTKAKESDTEKPFEDVIKSLDPAVQEVFKSLKAQKDAAEEVLKQKEAEDKEKQAIAKAKELKGLPVEESKLVSVVKGISDDVFEILKAAATAVEEGVLSEVGKGKGEDNTSGDAWAKIEKKADEIAKRDAIGKAHAVKKAITENPELYREYLDGGAN